MIGEVVFLSKKAEKLVSSLYIICLLKVAEILVKVKRKVSTSDNPFRAFPPTIVHDLIPRICERAMMEESLKSSFLHLLLDSDRVTYLNLIDVKISPEDAEEIFNYIQPYSKRLRSIKISHFANSNCPNSLWVSSNFGTILQSAKNLLALETSINFHFSELSSCIYLEKLNILFWITDHISSFLHVGDEIRYNHSLRMLTIENIQNFPDLYLDIAEILQYCVEIVEIDYDVSRSLVYLHENQKATKYKLQVTWLGDSVDSSAVSVTAVEIASLYCPDLREVVVSPADYLATQALSNFCHITELTLINDPEWSEDDFNKGVRLLLGNSHFGHNLKSLRLHNYSRIDFSCIGACCPNLNELHVAYRTEYNFSGFTTNSFQKLITLYLENVKQDPCEEDSIIGILSRATALEFLTIKNANLLNDLALEAILENVGVFSKLKIVILQKCPLTEPGLRNLVRPMVSLNYINYRSTVLSSEEINRILMSMNLIHSI